MKTKKIIILIILFVAISGFTMSTVTSADAAKTYKTGKIYLKDKNNEITKSIGGGDVVGVYYYSKLNKYWGNKMQISIHGKYDIEPNNRHLLKAKVKFVKNVGNKNKYMTKTFKNKSKYNSYIGYNPKNGYKPYYTIIYYKKT